LRICSDSRASNLDLRVLVDFSLDEYHGAIRFKA